MMEPWYGECHTSLRRWSMIAPNENVFFRILPTYTTLYGLEELYLQQCIRAYQLQHEGTVEEYLLFIGIIALGEQLVPRGSSNLEREIVKRGLTSFSCGKQGHYARDCRKMSYKSQMESVNCLVCSGKINEEPTSKIHINKGSSKSKVQ